MIKKTILICTFALLASVSASARSLVLVLNDSTKIYFLGVRRDVNELMQAADVMVFPSLFEGLPVTLVEAQSTGLPCIISQNIPSEAIITDLVEQVSLSDSASIWADKLISVVERPYDRVSYTKNIIKAGFDIKNNAEWLQQFYLDAIAK